MSSAQSCRDVLQSGRISCIVQVEIKVTVQLDHQWQPSAQEAQLSVEFVNGGLIHHLQCLRAHLVDVIVNHRTIVAVVGTLDAGLIHVVLRGQHRAQAFEIRITDGDDILPALTIVLRVELPTLPGNGPCFHATPKPFEFRIGGHMNLIIVHTSTVLGIDHGHVELCYGLPHCGEEVPAGVKHPRLPRKSHKDHLASVRRLLQQIHHLGLADRQFGSHLIFQLPRKILVFPGFHPGQT
mmetsp:Transcript_19983/g.46900  ORF Transcript_19983/g.46900 Transcript_19983/m.46900 type:complete len:238 (-) Transcript_19983:831-1544(-)